MSIEVGTSLIPGTANTPLDARCRVTQISDIPNISNPFLGMEIFCIANSKTYKVTKLKSKMIGSMSVANGAVDEYEEIPDAESIAELAQRITDLEGNPGSAGSVGTGMVTIANADELPSIQNAVIGQHIYITDPGKEIIVTGLTDGQISSTEDVPSLKDITDLDNRVKELENTKPGEDNGGNSNLLNRVETLEQNYTNLTANMETASASIDATIGVE